MNNITTTGIQLPKSNIHQHNSPFNLLRKCIRSNSYSGLANNASQLHRIIKSPSSQTLRTKSLATRLLFSPIPSNNTDDNADDLLQENSTEDIIFNNASKEQHRLMQLYEQLNQEAIQQLALLNYIDDTVLTRTPTPVYGIPKLPLHASKSIAFDLDGTLIYSQDNDHHYIQGCEQAIIQVDNRELCITLRPYAREMLCKLHQYFELLIYTSSNREYAKRVVNVLDKEGTLFSYILCREQCAVSGLHVIKDLRMTNRDMKNIVLVDNCMTCFRTQLENGVPVKSFTGSPCDKELLAVKEYLMKLLNAADVRTVNEEELKLKKLAILCKDQI